MLRIISMTMSLPRQFALDVSPCHIGAVDCDSVSITDAKGEAGKGREGEEEKRGEKLDGQC